MEKNIRVETGKEKNVFASGCFGAFLVLIFLVRRVDVAAIGPEDTSIGLSHINGFFHDFFGINMIWYKLTEVLGILALLVVALFACFGMIQLIQRKHIAKVDREILCLGGLYAVVLITYAFFEKVVVNYRPIIEEGAEHVEASFPSSHTMLIVTIFGTLMYVLDKYIKNENVVKICKVACLVIIGLTVVGRLVCGVHWFTDILGGCLISLCYISAFSSALRSIMD